VTTTGSEVDSDGLDPAADIHQLYNSKPATLLSKQENIDMRRVQHFVADCELFLKRKVAVQNDSGNREAHAVENKLASVTYLPQQARKDTNRVMRLTKSLFLKLKRPHVVRNECRLIQHSCLFDETYYSNRYPDTLSHAGGPVDHYVRFGHLEGRDPHPLFQTNYYLNQNPDVAHQGINPLVHYIRHGYKEGRNPHPYFNTEWYLHQIEPRSEATPNPAAHYIKIGASLGLSPSPDFDTTFYMQRYPDVALHNFNPLLHYLEYGIYEGRLATRAAAAFPASSSVMDASIQCMKFDVASSEVALFVTHSPDGYLKPHVMHYVTKLRENGICVILIIAADNEFYDESLDQCSIDGLFVRENSGFDFAAWVHVVRLYPTLLELDRLYILNDSLFGPTNDVHFKALLTRIRQDDADFIGITDSFELGWHIQSYFLVLRRKVLVSNTMRSFVESVVSYNDKDDVIKEYEVRFSQAIRVAGFKCNVLFPSTEVVNITLLYWKHLLHNGFPFVKVMAIRDGYRGGNDRTWRETLQAEGFDTNLINRTLLLARIMNIRSLIGTG
jgi:hypothetical protein